METKFNITVEQKCYIIMETKFNITVDPKFNITMDTKFNITMDPKLILTLTEPSYAVPIPLFTSMPIARLSEMPKYISMSYFYLQYLYHYRELLNPTSDVEAVVSDIILYTLASLGYIEDIFDCSVNTGYISQVSGKTGIFTRASI